MLAAAVALAPQQRRRYRLGGGQGGQLVGQHGAHQARARVVVAGLHRGQPGQRLDDGIVGRLGGVGPVLAEAADRAIDDVRRHRADVGLADGVGGRLRAPHAEAIDHAGAEILHEDVRLRGQPAHQVAARLRF